MLYITNEPCDAPVSVLVCIGLVYLCPGSRAVMLLGAYNAIRCSPLVYKDVERYQCYRACAPGRCKLDFILAAFSVRWYGRGFRRRIAFTLRAPAHHHHDYRRQCKRTNALWCSLQILHSRRHVSSSVLAHRSGREIFRTFVDHRPHRFRIYAHVHLVKDINKIHTSRTHV